MNEQLSSIWRDARAPETFAADVLERWQGGTSGRRSRRWRVALTGGATAAVVAGLLWLWLATGARPSVSLGPTASDVTRVEQRAGFASYRVGDGQGIWVRTPDGAITATNAHFSVEVETMKRELLSAVGGAAIAATVVVVYQGTVTAERGEETVAASAGQRIHLSADSARPATVTAVAPASATRTELVIRDRQNIRRIASLREKVAELEAKLETQSPSARGEAEGAPPAKKFLDLTEGELAVLADRCEIRYDIPAYAMANDVAPLFDRIFAGAKVSADERAILEAELRRGDPALLALLRSLYIEVTGDQAGADTLSPRNMQHEVFDKSLPADVNNALAAISAERAGRREAPTDLAQRPPVERLLRALAASGAKLEAAIADQLGAERAHELRAAGVVWARRSQHGCP